MRYNIKQLTCQNWCTTNLQNALEDVIAIHIHLLYRRLIIEVELAARRELTASNHG